jgi:hypothetical protein
VRSFNARAPLERHESPFLDGSVLIALESQPEGSHSIIRLFLFRITNFAQFGYRNQRFRGGWV